MRTAFVFFVLAVTSLTAGTLDLAYSVTPQEAGLYGYDFQLVNTGLPAGAKVGWVVFGSLLILPGWDGTGTAPEGFMTGQWGPIPGQSYLGGQDFLLTSPAPHPWSEIDPSGGELNGPVFGPPLDPALQWQTTGPRDFISWSGTSHRDLSGTLAFSAMFVTDSLGGPIDPTIQQLGTQVPPTATPEPASLWILGTGLLAMFVMYIVKKRA